jgi:hypothetical protein
MLRSLAGAIVILVEVASASFGTADDLKSSAPAEHRPVEERLRDIDPPLFVSDEQDHHEEIAAIRIYLEVKRVPSGVELTAARYRGTPVAYGQGKVSPAGDFALTLLQVPDTTPTGAFSLIDPATGEVDTTTLRFGGEGASFKFITARPLGFHGKRK